MRAWQSRILGLSVPCSPQLLEWALTKEVQLDDGMVKDSPLTPGEDHDNHLSIRVCKYWIEA